MPSETELNDLAALRRAAAAAGRGWAPERLEMALRAAGLDDENGGRRPSLAAIAEQFGVSRETARRARNDLVYAMADAADIDRNVYAALDVPPPLGDDRSPATARALRRMLTMTGPLPWDEVLNGWARAGGKPPHTALPDDANEMAGWVRDAGGLTVNASTGDLPTVTVGVLTPEQLDRVSEFLLATLRDQPLGLERDVIVGRAEAAGLKPTTISTALSTHPALTRLGRGTWTLRGVREVPQPALMDDTPRPQRRPRPTSFAWGADGSLLIEFTVPRGASPVIAVPKAVAAVVEGREFDAHEHGATARIVIRNAKLWGFSPLLTGADVHSGDRATIALNLIAGTTTLSPANRKDIFHR